MDVPMATVSMATAPSYAPASQEVLCPEDYDLNAEISQFTEFRDDSEPDIDENLINDVDNNDDLFISDDEYIEDSSEAESDDSDLELEPEPSSNGNIFAVPPLTGYPESFSKDEVLEKLNLFAKDHGFALVTKRSVLIRKTWYFGCDRGGEYREQKYLKPGQRRRFNTTTRLNGCKFQIRAQLKDGAWSLSLSHGEHNHEPSQDYRAHPTHRRILFSKADQETAVRLYQSGAKTKTVMSNLREKYHGTCPVTRQDLSNFRHRMVGEALQGRSPIQALLDEIDEDSDIMSKTLVDNENQITHLFLVHRKSVDIIRQNHDILLMDCTYKTNRYRMPLLNIIGVTSMHTTINLGFVFMHREKETDYE
jgi:MULE transposase domain